MAGLEDHVTCSICMDLYNDPLALPCLHSFCRHCVQGLFSSSLTISCPECRSEVNLGPRGVEGLMSNFQLAGIVESYKKENNDVRKRRAEGYSEQTYCAEHRVAGEIMCKTCVKPLCVKCLTSGRHPVKHKLKYITGVRSDDVMRRDSVCSEHERHFRLFCSDCEFLVCMECVAKRHSSHSLASMEDTYEYNMEILKGTLGELDSRQRLLKATQNTCRMLAQKTQEDAQKKRHDLVTYFSRLRDALDRKEAQMKSEVDRREQDTVQTYMTKADDTRRKEKMVAEAIGDVKRLLTENKTVLLKHYKSKSKRIAELLTDECADRPPQPQGVADVTLVTCSYEQELSNVHWRWPSQIVVPVRKAPPVPAKRKTGVARKLLGPSTPQQQLSLKIKVGCPVNRGKDWRDGMTDGGPGHVGTVTAVQVEEDFLLCTIRWPNGKTGQYRYSNTEEEIKPV